MEIAKTIQEVRGSVETARKGGKKVGFVPTMGALHIGHVSLIEAAVADCDFVVVSIFVNPSQFGPGEDFDKYPRTLDADLEMCRKAGADVVFVPENKEIYPSKNLTWVNVEELTDFLCGRSRQSHFRGVTTVCAKLFNIVQPDKAFFGQKDAQQCAVIRRMVADLDMPLEIVVCPTVREHDGLAISSRNKYLDENQRKDAALIYRSLTKSKEMIEAGATDCSRIVGEMQKILSQAAAIQIEYTSIVNAETLENIDDIGAEQVLIAVAVKIGGTRLIDNILVDAGQK